MVKKSNFCVLDTETTGLLNEDRAEIIEIAFQILDYKQLNVIAKFESLVKPKNIDLDKPLPSWAQGAFRINNISVDALKTAPSPEEICEKIIGILNAAKKPLFVAQNARFDLTMMERLFKSCGYDIYDYIYNPVIDLYALSILFWMNDANMPNIKLQTIAEKMGVKLEDTHRAMGDVQGTVEIFTKFWKFFADRGNEISNIQVKRQPKSDKKSDYICPQCGGDLRVRTAKKGKYIGSTFLGCSCYPKCKFLCSHSQAVQYKRK